MRSQIQSVYGLKPYWNAKDLKLWLKIHNIRPIKAAHITSREIRFRITPASHFRHFTTRVLPNGIHLVIGIV